MFENNITQQKAYNFALRVVNAYKHLSKEQGEYVLSKQLLRSGTAIGALISEAVHAQSRPDFLNKMNIALKEAYENEYWIRLLHDAGYISEGIYSSIYADCIELVKLLTSIVKTLKDSLGK